ncbi:hypothetical protein L211DRAFT_832127 [Terfezia boudieri ATCC MYA-4762]|uniref:Uncharacterized protein n=1 Tax=Terfezia boudieri ATCC MYA-4762 TaxID=1051890 RepID=A0A3N4MB98_9PEZI|nr:hypothetical protein L211DRAFT_832127 [Terfezia boudieri ATCC MYA-4762]
MRCERHIHARAHCYVNVGHGNDTSTSDYPQCHQESLYKRYSFWWQASSPLVKKLQLDMGLNHKPDYLNQSHYR